MSTITHDNVVVEGIPFSQIIYLYISHAPNTHGRAKIVGQIDSAFAQDFVQRLDETFGVGITTTAENQPERLFYGVVANSHLQQQQAYSLLTLELETVSCRTDAKKENHTYQNTGTTYGQLLSGLSSVKGYQGTVQIMVTDKPIGAMIMQYDETDWAFIIRMASQLGVPAFSNIIARTPQIYVGLPASSKTRQIDTVSFDYTKSDAAYQSITNNTPSAAGAMREDFATETVCSYDYAYLGDTVAFNGKTARVKSINATLVDGILECQYSFALKTGFSVPAISNKQASGRMMTGTVQAVQADRVQVFLHSVDSSYDGGGNWWFPYSTAYSSQDGSGWYSMPAVGDEVRVFFPSDNEADAFAASSVAKNVRPNITDKCWSGVNGKQILMTEEGLIIICKAGKLFINLTDAKGIEIVSDMDINITSGTKVNIQAGEEVKIVAKNEIMVGTPSAFLDIRKEGIVASAENIIIS